jgi:hypothetical protein
MYLRSVVILFAVTLFASLAVAENGQRRVARANANVLFIGSSYTYYFEMPAIVAAMSQAGPRELRTKMIAVGGATLEDHWDGPFMSESGSMSCCRSRARGRSRIGIACMTMCGALIERSSEMALKRFSMRPGRDVKIRNDRPISTQRMN